LCAALITGVTIGLVNPVPGCLAQKYSLSNWSTFGIFLVSGKDCSLIGLKAQCLYFLITLKALLGNVNVDKFVQGLTLRSGEMSAAIEAWPAGAFGLVWFPFLATLFFGWSRLCIYYILHLLLLPRNNYSSELQYQSFTLKAASQKRIF
jgi:hypothetical protein